MMPDSAQQYFVAHKGKHYGPFSASQLKEYAAAKKLLPDDKVRQEDISDWVPAKSLSWLFPPAADTGVMPLEQLDAADSHDLLDLRTLGGEPAGPLSMKGIRIRPGFALSYGDFQLLRKLGAGGMGAVYLALQRSTCRRLALKMLSEELAQKPLFLKRFYRESLLLGELDHPHIVKGYGLGEELGIPFLAMEYVDGPSATQIMRKIGRLEIGDALHIVWCCAQGLGYGHRHNIIHRDVTPSNVLINRAGLVKLSDFGVAKPTHDEVSKLTDHEVVLGTPRYMAPEQSLDSKYADARSDIYSLGCILYQFLTGQLPFHGATAMELLRAKQVGQFTPAHQLNDAVPARLDRLIAKLLAHDPRHRPQSCADLSAEIESLGLRHAHLHLQLDAFRMEVAAVAATEGEKLEILMVQPQAEEVRLAQKLLRNKRIAAHGYVAGTIANAVRYLRREETHASAPRPELVILGCAVTPEGCAAVLGELQQQSLSELPIIVLSESPQSTLAFLQPRGLLPNVFVLKHEDRLLLSDLLASARDMCVTQAELKTSMP